jgi:hypothetical protein
VTGPHCHTVNGDHAHSAEYGGGAIVAPCTRSGDHEYEFGLCTGRHDRGRDALGLIGRDG